MCAPTENAAKSNTVHPSIEPSNFELVNMSYAIKPLNLQGGQW